MNIEPTNPQAKNTTTTKRQKSVGEIIADRLKQDNTKLVIAERDGKSPGELIAALAGRRAKQSAAVLRRQHRQQATGKDAA